jgi:hypothetical protein
MQARAALMKISTTARLSADERTLMEDRERGGGDAKSCEDAMLLRLRSHEVNLINKVSDGRKVGSG